MNDAPAPSVGKKKSLRGPASSVAAVLIVATLGLAAAGKLMGPDEKKTLFETDILLDHVVAGGEILMILLVLALHRTKLIWPVVAVMFSGFFGYATYWTLTEGKPCGCFGELWEPPLGVSMGIDAVAALAGFAFTVAYGGRAILLTLALLASVGAGWFGYDYAYRHSPEIGLDQNDGMTAPERFLASDMMTFARDVSLDEFAPAHLVFIHEIGCHTCEMYLADMELFGETLEARDDELLRIHEYSVNEVQEATGINPWEWPSNSPPTLFVIEYGQIIPVPGSPNTDKMEWTGDETPFDIIQIVYEFFGGDFAELEDEAYAQ